MHTKLLVMPHSGHSLLYLVFHSHAGTMAFNVSVESTNGATKTRKIVALAMIHTTMNTNRVVSPLTGCVSPGSGNQCLVITGTANHWGVTKSVAVRSIVPSTMLHSPAQWAMRPRNSRSSGFRWMKRPAPLRCPYRSSSGMETH